VIGPGLSEWIRGDFVISDATLNRFFAFHVIALPLVLVMLVFLHIVALHKVGSSNPDGIEIKKNKGPDGHPVDGIPFHPYYTVKDIVGVVVFLAVFAAIIFFAPEMGGWFLEHDNFVPANILQTPPEIVPLWYFTPFYSILRACTSDFMIYLAIFLAVIAFMTVRRVSDMKAKVVVAGAAVVVIAGLFILEAKFWGVVAMGASIVVLFFLPWLDQSPVKSIRYRGWMYKTALGVFAVTFLVLGYLGTQPPAGLAKALAQIGTLIYFSFFAFLPWYSRIDATKPVPERVS
jgi:ubiquinol-cytochrome c reductase cytochrome b subunit